MVCPCFFLKLFLSTNSTNSELITDFNLHYRPSFRSYKPADESLKDLALPEPEIEEITDKVKDDLDNEDKGVVMESLVCIYQSLCTYANAVIK